MGHCFECPMASARCVNIRKYIGTENCPDFPDCIVVVNGQDNGSGVVARNPDAGVTIYKSCSTCSLYENCDGSQCGERFNYQRYQGGTHNE